MASSGRIVLVRKESVFNDTIFNSKASGSTEGDCRNFATKSLPSTSNDFGNLFGASSAPKDLVDRLTHGVQGEEAFRRPMLFDEGHFGSRTERFDGRS